MAGGWDSGAETGISTRPREGGTRWSRAKWSTAQAPRWTGAAPQGMSLALRRCALGLIRQMQADIGDSVLAGQPYPTAHTGLAKGAICSGKNSTARVVLL